MQSEDMLTGLTTGWYRFTLAGSDSEIWVNREQIYSGRAAKIRLYLKPEDTIEVIGDYTFERSEAPARYKK